MTKNCVAKRLKVNGIVQGVGFRPFIFQLAEQYGLKGEVANTSSGVAIQIEGSAGQVASFEADISAKSPLPSTTTMRSTGWPVLPIIFSSTIAKFICAVMTPLYETWPGPDDSCDVQGALCPFRFF